MDVHTAKSTFISHSPLNGVMDDKHSHLIMEREHMEKLYSSSNPFEKRFFNQRLACAVALADVQSHALILDAGCGEGQLLKYIEDRWPTTKRWGVDVTDVAIESARSRTKSTIVKQDLANLTPFKDGFFDAVFCLDVIEHVKDYRPALEELKRVTRKDGRIIIAFPNDYTTAIARVLLRKYPPITPDHINRFTPRRLGKLLNLPCIKTKRLPGNLPFFMSLWCVCSFCKK